MQNHYDFQNSSAMQEAIRLAQTEAGQHLLSMLQQTHPDQLHTFMEKARSGDMDQTKKAMQQILANPDIQALLKQLGG